MNNLPNFTIPWDKHFGFLSAADAINGIAAGWRRLQASEHAKDRDFIVTMRTNTGEILVVGHLRPEGFSSFSADGFVGDKPVMVVGHISTLQLTCSLEERSTANVKRIGFKPQVTDLEISQEDEHSK
jgi:hypothetical protein